jgi:putative ABC transport system permease protein
MQQAHQRRTQLEQVSQPFGHARQATDSADMRSARVPLAWKNLTADRRKLSISIAGLGFVVLLIFMQLGFRNAMLDSSVEPIRKLDADLVLTGSTYYRFFTRSTFPRRRLYQALADPAVKSASPLYFERDAAVWKNPVDHTTDNIRVLAFDPDRPVFQIPEVRAHLRQLREPDTVMFDSDSRASLGTGSAGDVTELSGRRVRIVGTFEMGPDFAVDGTVIMSDQNFLRIFEDRTLPGSSLDSVDFGVIRLDNPHDAPAVQARLDKNLPDDVHVLTREEFAEAERAYWKKASPVGFVFGLGSVMGFVVGLVICYQILFSDISESLPQFATLKAIGYTNGYLRGIVVRQAVYLALLGFVPSLAITAALYALIATATGLMLRLTAALAVAVLVLTVVMCVISGLLAVRKVLAMDPAEVF